MTRFAWLQARTQIAIAAGALAVVAVIVALTGPHLHHLYDVNVATCSSPAGCDLARAGFLKNDKTLFSWFGGVLLVFPLVLGVFWGPPLVARELETGTFRLAWSQGISRTRWIVAKLAVVGLAAMAATGLLSLLISWWASPIDAVRGDRFAAPLFDERGVVPIGYAAFAFAVGVTAGVIIRRTLPAMATTLVVLIAAKVGVIQLVRPKFQAAAAKAYALDPTRIGFGRRNSGPVTLQPDSPSLPGAWIRSVRIVDQSGHAMTPERSARSAPTSGSFSNRLSGIGTDTKAPDDLKASLDSCVTKVAAKYHELVRYQPAKRYWLFQWYELALFLGVAVALCALCVWWVRRRLT